MELDNKDGNLTVMTGNMCGPLSWRVLWDDPDVRYLSDGKWDRVFFHGTTFFLGRLLWACWCTLKTETVERNRSIKTDSFLIPRVEDLIERITRLKYEVNVEGCLEMWISTLDLRTSFWQLTLDEDSRPLISFNTPTGTYMGTCVPMGLLTSHFFFFFSPFLLVVFVSGHLRIWRGVIFCGPRYFEIFRERTWLCVDGEDGIG
jgi:hypothetical protein